MSPAAEPNAVGPGVSAAPRSVTTPFPTFRQALAWWFRLGCISFGGPAGQIAIMHSELVDRRRWISERRFLHALNYCMILPGPEAQQLATYIGWLLHGTWGGIAAGALFVLPSMVVLATLSWLYVVYGQVPAIAAIFAGIKPAVVAIVATAVLRIGSRAVRTLPAWLLAGASFVALAVFQVPFPAVVAAAAAIGWIASRIRPGTFSGGGGHTASGHAAAESHLPAPVIADDVRLPHTHPHRGRFALHALVGGTCWALPLAALVAWEGWQGTFTQIGWFFTQAALVTFGGAYAVLPFVADRAVASYGWLSAGQMIDGLALGETTPGPLIMVVAFVGFLGGWHAADVPSPALAAPANATRTNSDLGPASVPVPPLTAPTVVSNHRPPAATTAHPSLSRTLSGLIGLVVATYFTFLPSFVFILLGAPFIESMHGELHWNAALSAVTAAVVGAVLHLALFFGRAVLHPEVPGPTCVAGWDLAALVIGLIAFVALWRWKQSIPRVVAAAAAVGWLLGRVVR